MGQNWHIYSLLIYLTSVILCCLPAPKAKSWTRAFTLPLPDKSSSGYYSSLGDYALMYDVFTNFEILESSSGLELRLTTSTRLKTCLYSFTSPGGPMYPTRAVRHAAWDALDFLFPVSDFFYTIHWILEVFDWISFWRSSWLSFCLLEVEMGLGLLNLMTLLYTIYVQILTPSLSFCFSCLSSGWEISSPCN